MGQYERLMMMAEDELTQYSTDARKMEKLRRKIGLSVTPAQQKAVKDQLESDMPKDPFRKLIASQRQMVALPFWGITGLGLLFGISMMQPLDLIATGVGGAIAIYIQKLGWRLEAQKLLFNTLDEIETRSAQPR